MVDEKQSVFSRSCRHFARRPYAGWTCLGNEIDGLDIREAISRRLEGGPYSG